MGSIHLEITATANIVYVRDEDKSIPTITIKNSSYFLETDGRILMRSWNLKEAMNDRRQFLLRQASKARTFRDGKVRSTETPVPSSEEDQGFMKLPAEIQIVILDLLPDANLARMACVCKELNFLASDDKKWMKRFWDKFAEHYYVPRYGHLTWNDKTWKDKFGKWARAKNLIIMLMSGPSFPGITLSPMANWPPPYRMLVTLQWVLSYIEDCDFRREMAQLERLEWDVEFRMMRKLVLDEKEMKKTKKKLDWREPAIKYKKEKEMSELRKPVMKNMKKRAR